MDDQQALERSFGEVHFGSAELGDMRRTRRLVQVADQMVKHPGGTLPDKFSDPASLKGLYRLVARDEVTHEAVLAPSRERTLRLASEASGTVLHIHDGTEFDYSGLHSLKDLGQIGNGNGRGYLAHNTLTVVAETREVLGLVYQKLIKRPKAPKKETRKQCRDRPDRESRMWKDASKTIPAAPPGRRWVEVADRGADLLEFIDYHESAGKSYLVRSKHNRCIALENKGKTKLHDYVRALPATDTKTVEVPATSKHPARTVTVGIAWAEVTLLIPRQPRGEVRGVPLKAWVICVQEIKPPDGVEPVEWILLTNVPVHNAEDARERIFWYECRWIIEEYHKAMKTGASIEDLQFTKEERLQPVIALLSVIALFLLNLRNASRRADAQERPASELLPVEFVTVLALWRYKKLQTDLTVHEFYYALARLGGHQNRKHDHPPGWLILWRGWTKLQAMVDITTAFERQRCG
jgi:hypothetical protein